MLEILVLILAAIICLLAGFWIRGSSPGQRKPRSPSTVFPRTDSILAQVGALSRDVDHHKLLVQRISAELHALDPDDSVTTIRAINKLVESNERMQSQLMTAEQKLQEQAREIADHSLAAQTDPLTKLSNRRAFDAALTEAREAFVDRHQPTTIMMLDIDHFKSINDSYGHQAGDQVLQSISQVLTNVIPPDHLVARIGGEEFAVLFRNSNIGDIVTFAEEARQVIQAAAVEFTGLTLRTSISFGLAQFIFGDSIASLVGRADAAMYTSKSAGRNCGHLHDGTTIIRLSDWLAVDDQRDIASKEDWETEVGISSPKVFCDDVRRRLSDFRDGVAPLSVLFIQMDELPFEIGSEMDSLQRAASRAITLTIKATMREMDHVARLERDALSVLLPGCTLAGAAAVAERLRTAIRRCQLPAKYGQRRITVSLGVAEAMEDEDEEQLIYRGRQSIAAARASGQDCTYVHDGADCRLIGAGHVTMANR